MTGEPYRLLPEAERTPAGLVFRAFQDGTADYQVLEVRDGEPAARPWRTHQTDVVAVPLRGVFTLEWRQDRRRGTESLTPGREYVVPAGVAHRLTSSGGLLELYIPAGSADE